MMPDTEVLVRFRPADREVYVLPDTRLLEAAAEAGLRVEVPCGGEGLCGKCRVVVSVGADEPTDAERQAFSDAELAAGWRLACQSAVRGLTEVEIPPASRAAAEHQAPFLFADLDVVENRLHGGLIDHRAHEV